MTNEFNTKIMVQCPFCGYAMITPNSKHKYLWCSHCQLICPESEDGTPSGAYAAFDKLIDRIRNYNPENYPTPTEEEKKFFWMRDTYGDDAVAEMYNNFDNGFVFKEAAIEEARGEMNEGDSFRILELTEKEFCKLGGMVLP